MKVLKVAIIGCGLIGRKRAMALSNKFSLINCFDINNITSTKFAKYFSAQSFEKLDDIYFECKTNLSKAFFDKNANVYIWSIVEVIITEVSVKSNHDINKPALPLENLQKVHTWNNIEEPLSFLFAAMAKSS